MKIIKLGDFIFQLTCPRCLTIIEIGTHELTKEDNKYSIKCPLCNNKIILCGDLEVCDIANKRIELQNSLSKSILQEI